MTRYGYARVSTDKQDFASQIAALEADGCSPIIRERASGARTDRPLLAALTHDLQRGDVLVVYRLDRLARSVAHLIEMMQLLEQAGVVFVSLSDRIDTSTASGRLTFHLFAALAEFERNLTIERTHAGLDAARAAGRTGGRPRALSEQQLKKARAWLSSGDMNQTEVARALGVDRSTLSRSLRASP